MTSEWVLNTCSRGKLQEFQRLFARYGVVLAHTEIDIEEIEADPVTVVVYKASTLGEGILIEDTSLEIEGASVGVNVRWLLGRLHQYVGRKTTWRSLLARQNAGQVYVYEGKICGTIVQPKGKGGFGFDPFFLPENSTYTLAEAKPDSVNARAKAVEALMQGITVAILPPISHWEGPWQGAETE
jgi:XTP/dITP diphosphohydrolase